LFEIKAYNNYQNNIKNGEKSIFTYAEICCKINTIIVRLLYIEEVKSEEFNAVRIF